MAIFTKTSEASPRRHGVGFWITGYAFLAVMAFSALPTPLYVLYQQRDGFSTFMITVIFAAYAVGVVISLFLAGHSSDWLGRRRALAPAVALSAVSAAVFLAWPELPGLLVGRVLNGLSVGVVTATATAYLAELHAAQRPQASPRRAQVVATAANLGGLGLGPLVSGLLAGYVAGPLTLPFELFIPALALGAVALALVPETRERPTPRPAYRPQRVVVPPDGRGRFFAAATGAVIAFAALGMFTSLAPTFLAGALGDTSRALAGAAAFAVFAAAVLAQTMTGARPPGELLAGGIGTLLAGLALVVLAVWLPAPSLALFLSGGAITGAGAGLVFKGAMATTLALAPPDHRAEVVAGLFLAAYTGLAISVVGLGLLTQFVQDRDALLVFAVVELVGALATTRLLLSRGAGGTGRSGVAATAGTP
jgi:MFS family permease